MQRYDLNPKTGNVLCDNCAADIEQLQSGQWVHCSETRFCSDAEPSELDGPKVDGLSILSHKLGYKGEINREVFEFLALVSDDEVLCRAEKDLGIVSRFYRQSIDEGEPLPLSRQYIADWCLEEIDRARSLAAVDVETGGNSEETDKYISQLEQWESELRD